MTPGDYATTFPPKYSGPELPASLAKRWAAYQEEDADKKQKPPPKPLPGLDEFLAAAEAEYVFKPERIPEREFKVRYAREAVSLGLTGDQVVRVYALETSGLGTADMISGIHPIKKTGKPISSAIGYAQLLAANSTDELVQHGATFLGRLKGMAAEPGGGNGAPAVSRREGRGTPPWTSCVSGSQFAGSDGLAGSAICGSPHVEAMRAPRENKKPVP